MMHSRSATLEDRLHAGVQDRGLEWFAALCMLAWGLTLAADGNTLDGPQYAAFRRMNTTEEFWAVTFSLVAGARLGALYINGRWPKTPYVRMLGSFVGVISWLQVSWLLFESSYLQTGVWNTGVGVYGLFALAELFSIFRAAFDARYYRS